MKIQVKILDEEFIKTFGLPMYETEGSVAMDLRARQRCGIDPHATLLIPTGIAIAIPPGYVGLITPRSSFTLKRKATVGNSPGVIDSDYRGEIHIIIQDHRERQGLPHYIERGERIAQLLIVPIAKVEWEIVDELSRTKRGSGGFGSTGDL